MRSLDQIAADARPGRAFSNGTMGYGWMEGWCYECKVDGPFQRDEVDEGCPILLVAMLGESTPKEWTDQGLQDYHCSEFVEDDNGDDEGDPTPPAPTGPAVEIAGQQDILGVWAEQAIDRAQREQPVAI